jgi:hypothetical protein
MVRRHSQFSKFLPFQKPLACDLANSNLNCCQAEVTCGALAERKSHLAIQTNAIAHNLETVPYGWNL